MRKEGDALSLVLFYHLNSEPLKNPVALTPARDLLFWPSAPFVQLPEPPVGKGLAGLLRERRSVRAFRNSRMPLAYLSDLLYAAGGLTQIRKVEGHVFEGRTTPSAGGLYPLEIFVATRAVEGLADGLFHYQAQGHGIRRLGKAELESFVVPFVNQVCIAGANALFLFTSIFMRSLGKYGPRGYRYALFEAGHRAQNIALMAVELGLGSLCLGGFYDREVNALLGIDGAHHAALYCVAVGDAAAE